MVINHSITHLSEFRGVGGGGGSGWGGGKGGMQRRKEEEQISLRRRAGRRREGSVCLSCLIKTLHFHINDALFRNTAVLVVTLFSSFPIFNSDYLVFVIQPF